jgi:hypothetical protein
MGNMNVQSTMTKYLVARIGQTIIINEACKETGLRDEQVRAVMRRIIAQNKMDIDVISKGHVWRVNSAAPKAQPAVAGVPLADLNEPITHSDGTPASVPPRAKPRAPWEKPGTWELYEPVGKASDGSQIVRLEDSSLWKLTAL